MEKLAGGKGDGRPDSDFDLEQLASGIEIEMEHTKDFSVAKEIAKDHLTEDPNYYKKLKKYVEKAGRSMPLLPGEIYEFLKAKRRKEGEHWTQPSGRKVMKKNGKIVPVHVDRNRKFPLVGYDSKTEILAREAKKKGQKPQKRGVKVKKAVKGIEPGKGYRLIDLKAMDKQKEGRGTTTEVIDGEVVNVFKLNGKQKFIQREDAKYYPAD